jgi:eukaryotic-like serine/threonine-protein kinase
MDRRGQESEEVGPYRLVRKIGGDAAGALYEAIDPANGRRFALRLLEAAHSPACTEAQACLRARVLTAARLAHPNVVAVHDCGWHRGMPFVACEWIEGAEPLGKYLLRAGPLPVFQRLALVVQMLCALAFAHERRMVHGALRVDHLLVSRTGQLKVDGFGWANTVDTTHPCRADPAVDVEAAAAIARDLLLGAPRDGVAQVVCGSAAGLEAALPRSWAATAGSEVVTAAQLSARLQAIFGTPAWAGEVSRPPVVVTSTLLREGAWDARPLAMAPTPVAVLSSVRAQRIELALAACCLAVVGWAANLMVDGASAASPAVADVRGTVTAPAPGAVEISPPLPRAAESAPWTQGVPAVPGAQIPPAAPQQVQHPPASMSPAAPVAAPPAPQSRPVAARTLPEAHPRSAPPGLPTMQAARAVQQAAAKSPAPFMRRVSGPESRCQHGLALTRDICVALYCQSVEYRRTASCVWLHAQGRRVAGLPAEAHGGP